MGALDGPDDVDSSFASLCRRLPPNGIELGDDGVEIARSLGGRRRRRRRWRRRQDEGRHDVFRVPADLVGVRVVVVEAAGLRVQHLPDDAGGGLDFARLLAGLGLRDCGLLLLLWLTQSKKNKCGHSKVFMNILLPHSQKKETCGHSKVFMQILLPSCLWLLL